MGSSDLAGTQKAQIPVLALPLPVPLWPQETLSQV